MKKYTQTCPVYFGAGAISCLPDRLKECRAERPMFVTGQTVSSCGILDKAAAFLEEAGIEYLVYNQMKMDAPDYLCTEAAKYAQENGADAIIGLGGGSCLDAAKAIAVLCGNPENTITQLITGTPFEHKPLPMILIPTTSGTGSENTIFAVITCSQDGRKRSLFVSADAAIVDPELTLTLPASVTAYTGMDALAHAVEAYTSCRPSCSSDMMSLEAIRKIAKWLPAACEDGQNMEARENMAAASNFAGIAFNNSATHIGHAMAHAIGATLHVPHGIACAWVTPEVLKLMAKYLPGRAADIAAALGMENTEKPGPEELGIRIAAEVRALMRKTGIPSCEQQHVSKEMMASCGDYAVMEKLRGLCGAPVTDDEIRLALVNCVTDY